ncbi:ABC transporter permease [Gaiella sp.]|uniref:ABC transporter permease n=1 Tax=Gaiella sp. TaxID=2663207 RepID=UPI002CBF4B76|nr:ABC transporter permease [Gaiella sp.]HWO81394.1 ABC transporter permease [Gaiella sp.]
MLRNVFLKSLRDLRRSFAWWTVGLAGYVALIASVYPTVRDNPDLEKLVESYPEALKAFVAFGGQFDFTSAAGYLGSELFSFMMPALFLVAAVGHGAGTLAGEEERGTIDLLLSSPLSRTRVALEKLAAMCVELAALGVVLWLALWVGARAFSMEVSVAHLASATALLVVLALAYGAIAFMVAAATGRKTLAIGLTVALAVGAYLVNSLASLVEVLEPFQKATPFYHYAVADPLRQGLDPWHTLFLLAVGAVAAAAGVLLFDRRDLA